MSLKIVKTLALDFTRNAPLEYIFVKAGDKNSRVLDITPLNSGLAYAIPAGVKVVFSAKKNDEKWRCVVGCVRSGRFLGNRVSEGIVFNGLFGR